VHPVVYCLAVVRVEKESSLTSVTASACIQNNTVHYIALLALPHPPSLPDFNS